MRGIIGKAVSWTLQWLFIGFMYSRPSLRKERRAIEQNKRELQQKIEAPGLLSP